MSSPAGFAEEASSISSTLGRSEGTLTPNTPWSRGVSKEPKSAAAVQSEWAVIWHREITPPGSLLKVPA